MGIKAAICDLGAEEHYIPFLQGKVSLASPEGGGLCSVG